MVELDLVPTGGRWGPITRLRAQTRRLFSCAVSANYFFLFLSLTQGTQGRGRFDRVDS
jgi:hypothetical protein